MNLANLEKLECPEKSVLLEKMVLMEKKEAPAQLAHQGRPVFRVQEANQVLTEAPDLQVQRVLQANLEPTAKREKEE